MKKLITSSVLAAIVAVSPAAIALASDGVSVVNINSADVSNYVGVSASTGGNSADGGYAGGVGAGGSVIGSDNDDNTTGNGGNGGNGGDGGLVVTGPAGAGSSIENKVNTNITDVDFCGCDPFGEEDTWVDVTNINSAYVHNYVGVAADTGGNTADGGSTGGGAGAGGDVIGDDNDDNTTGNGGNGGHGGWGGQVGTGGAGAGSDIVNRVNKNVTRIN